MPTVKSLPDLDVWIQARRLANQVFDQFENHPQPFFRNQMLAAATSVMNNIAEGFERGSSNDFARFLDIARGSSAETSSMLHLAMDRAYIEQTHATQLIEDYHRLNRSISALSRYLRNHAKAATRQSR